MRANIRIDDDLMREARKATGLKTKKAVVEEALRRVVKCREQLETLGDLMLSEVLHGVTVRGSQVETAGIRCVHDKRSRHRD